MAWYPDFDEIRRKFFDKFGDDVSLLSDYNAWTEFFHILTINPSELKHSLLHAYQLAEDMMDDEGIYGNEKHRLLMNMVDVAEDCYEGIIKVDLDGAVAEAGKIFEDEKD